MDRRGLAVFRGSFLVLVTAACVSVQSACQYPAATHPAPAAVSPVPAAAPAPAIQLADGTWRVQGTRVPGSRRCGEWLVHLTSAGGQLSGTVSHARNTAILIQNLVLMPDGSFSGSAPASLSGSRRAPPATITGQFTGNTVNLTFDSERCPPRQGTATRRVLGG
jgi:hypothetical protein